MNGQGISKLADQLFGRNPSGEISQGVITPGKGSDFSLK
jgi:hypothetical protein